MVKNQPRPSRWNYFWNAVAILFFLPLAIITVAEMSIRSKAKEYIQFKQSEVQQLLVNGFGPTNSDVSSSRLSAYKSLSAKLSQAVADLESLIVVGGYKSSDTVQHIMSNALDQVSFFDQQVSRDALSNQRSETNNQLRELEPISDFTNDALRKLGAAENTLPGLLFSYANTVGVDTTSKIGSEVRPLSPSQITSAKEVLDTLADLTRSIGAIEEEHISAKILDTFDRSILRLLSKYSDIELQQEIPTSTEVQSILNLFETTKTELQNEAEQLEFRQAQLKDQITTISAQIIIADEGLSLRKQVASDRECGFGFLNAATINNETILTGTSTSNLAERLDGTIIPCPTLITALFPSDLLRAISVIASGAMGSFFLAFYFKNIGDISDRLAIGIIGGFVALLFLQGGKFLFVIEMDASAQHNPFSGALVGFLAGLFTDKGFESLKTIADLAAKRVIDRHESQDDPLPELQGPPRPKPANASDA